MRVLVLLASVVSIGLAGCEGVPQDGAPDEMFEYESKPVGDPSIIPYRPQSPTIPPSEVPPPPGPMRPGDAGG